MAGTLCLAGLVACAPSAAPLAQAPPQSGVQTALTGPVPLVLGETFAIDSHVLRERRVINVYLPPDYRRGSQRYPVLYMPDGGVAEDFPHITGLIDVSIKNQVVVPRLVIGIENTERRRDLVGPTTVAAEREAAPHAGGSERFRRFLRDELKPYVAAHYRITAESAIVGESLAGLFVLETLLDEPTLFDTYIAIDPSVWWNQSSSSCREWSAQSRTPVRLGVQPSQDVWLGSPWSLTPFGPGVFAGVTGFCGTADECGECR